MAKAINKLKALYLTQKLKPGRYSDGDGLWLQVTQTGSKSWLFQYAMSRRTRQMGLGSARTVSLAEARDLAADLRKLVSQGKDPLAVRDAEQAKARAEHARAICFREAAEQFIEQRKLGWRNAKHAAQWKSTLSTYAYPVIGDVAVGAIDRGMILAILEPIWTTKTETAVRLRSRMENILDAAKARGWRAGDNPAAWRGHLDKILPARRAVQKVRHHPAAPYCEIPGLMAELRGRNDQSAKALEFTILTACRTGEAIGARWDEIDFAQKTWIIPAERMKAGREHRVPLSARALELVKGLPRERDNPFVFLGNKPGKHLSNMAMLELIRDLRPGLTVHGFRSSFRDWTSEQTSYSREVAEMALAHAISDKSEASYRRGDLLEKRRRLAEDWSKYCRDKVARGAQNVVPIRAAG